MSHHRPGFKLGTHPLGPTVGGFQKDYTDFWYANVVSGGGAKGFITVSAKMADNLALLLAKPEYQNVHKYWD